MFGLREVLHFALPKVEDEVAEKRIMRRPAHRILSQVDGVGPDDLREVESFRSVHTLYTEMP
jgi:hypothetical protein